MKTLTKKELNRLITETDKVNQKCYRDGFNIFQEKGSIGYDRESYLITLGKLDMLLKLRREYFPDDTQDRKV